MLKRELAQCQKSNSRVASSFLCHLYLCLYLCNMSKETQLPISSLVNWRCPGWGLNSQPAASGLPLHYSTYILRTLYIQMYYSLDLRIQLAYLSQHKNKSIFTSNGGVWRMKFIGHCTLRCNNWRKELGSNTNIESVIFQLIFLQTINKQKSKQNK